MGSRGFDDLKKFGHELKKIFGNVKKPFVFGNLIHSMLSQSYGIEKVKNGPPLTRASGFQVQRQLPLQLQ